jgi:hypothetical protein
VCITNAWGFDAVLALGGLAGFDFRQRRIGVHIIERKGDIDFQMP